MARETTGSHLSTVFVDYDNIYLSLKRKSEEAARRFAKDAHVWVKGIESGRLITPTNRPTLSEPRRIVMNRCYGNPVPRRNNNDNSTDMNSFPFVRHHFLRAGFEVIDCPPLTAQLKNSADIRMVMDVRDYLNHDTYFDEFIILSGDADFTPVLHRLRAHARRTVIFANDYTAQPYTAISDGEVRESDLIALLLDGNLSDDAVTDETAARPGLPSSADLERSRREILAHVIADVRAAGQPVPLEALADRAVRALGHERTAGSAWGGAGSFRDLLAKGLTDDVRLSDEPPYYVFDASRRIAAEPQRSLQRPEAAIEDHRRSRPEPIAVNTPAAPQSRTAAAPIAQPQTDMRPTMPLSQPAADPAPATLQQMETRVTARQPVTPQAAPVARDVPAATSRPSEGATAIQQSIARIHEACQAPPLSPPEYRTLFEIMAQEITQKGLAGTQTLVNIMQRAQEMGVAVRRDDVRFILDVISETDPWFEQGASANLFSGRFRNFVVKRCRSQGLNLSADELDLIEAWFAAAPQPAQRPSYGRTPQQPPAEPVTPPPQAPMQDAAAPAMTASPRPDRWWTEDDRRQLAADPADGDTEEFPRIVRSRLRG